MNADRMVYFILVAYKSGPAWTERAIEHTDRLTTIRDMAAGEFRGDVLKVLECNPVENICNDVTEEFELAAEQITLQAAE